MNEALAQLEKRKLKPTVRASWIVFGLFFVIGLSVAGYFQFPTSGVLTSIPFVLVLFAMVLGAASAIGLRKEPERSAQEFLPIPPSTKLIAAFRVQLKNLLFLFLAGMLLSGMSGTSLPLGTLGDSGFWLLAGFLLHLNLASFFFCYWLSQPVMACGVAFFLSAGFMSLILLARASVKQLLPFADYFVSPIMSALQSASAVTAFITFPLAIAWLFYSSRSVAKRIEVGQRIRIPQIVWISASIILPALIPAALLGVSIYFRDMKASEFRPFAEKTADYFHDQKAYPVPGAILVGATGRIAHVDSGGRTRLLYTPTEQVRVLDIESDKSGTLWALIQPVNNEGALELWSGRVDKAFEMEKPVLVQQGRETADITVLNGEVLLRKLESGLLNGSYQAWSSKTWLPVPENAPRWNPNKIVRNEDGDTKWLLIFGNEMVKMDGAGKTLASAVLPGEPVRLNSTDGIYYELNRKLYLIDWNFQTREIRGMRLEE